MGVGVRGKIVAPLTHLAGVAPMSILNPEFPDCARRPRPVLGLTNPAADAELEQIVEAVRALAGQAQPAAVPLARTAQPQSTLAIHPVSHSHPLHGARALFMYE